MSASVQVSTNLRIVSSAGLFGNYAPPQASFVTTLTSFKGPFPGYQLIPTAGIAISFSQLTTPGFCRMQNLDPTNYVEYGIKDPGTGLFYPLGEIGPGETYVIKFSRNLLEDYTNAGTGTSGDINNLWLKANTAACGVVIEAFESA